MSIIVIVTIGPSISSNSELLKRINSLVSCIFRINGAHGTLKEIEDYIDYIRKTLPNSKIMIDLPGNKIRLSNIETSQSFETGVPLTIKSSNLNYPSFISELQIGDKILANDSMYQFKIIEIIDNKEIKMVPNLSGKLSRGKGIHLKGKHSNIPFLFKKDYDLLDISLHKKVDFVSLSYVRNKEDIGIIKDYLSSDNSIEIVAKIETSAAVNNLSSIIKEVDFLNIDRGDLSTEVDIVNVPEIQKLVLTKVKKAGKKIFLATQFLKNMENSPVPSIPEVFGIHEAFGEGVDGLQLSEETAVGDYPFECVKYIADAYNNFISSKKSS